ncbi:MAG TPA: hypothetical protein PLF11_10485 [Bacillota bacterium]|nr:hypothetical protein [Bacillota bacterium]
MREILRFTAPTTAATSGTFTLTDPNYFYAGATAFRLPLGCKAKLWSYTLSGTAFTAMLEVSKNGTDYEEVSRWDLQSDGIISETYEGRPEVFLDSRSGDEMFRVTFAQSDAIATSRIALVVEISDEE